MKISKILFLFFLLLLLQGCTLITTVAGPFWGIYARGKTYVGDIQGDRLRVIEKIGLTLALPVTLIAGAAEGLIIGPFVGFGADIEYISTGKIDLSRFKDHFSDGTDKYEPQIKKNPAPKKKKSTIK